MTLRGAADHWQLFIDDGIIARSTGLTRVVHHPKQRGVVIAADRPWETAGVAPGFVRRRDDGTFEAIYHAYWWDIERSASIANAGFRRDRAHHMFHGIGYATSSDGIHWEKPALRLTEAPSGTDMHKHAPFPTPSGVSTDNNLGVPFVVLADLGAYGNVADPARRFALRSVTLRKGSDDLGSSHNSAARNYFAGELPDFRNDDSWQERLTDIGSELDPRHHALHFWDDIHDEWVAMSQGVIGHWFPSRDIARFASADLNNWTSDTVLYPDCADSHSPEQYDEPMGLTPFCAEGVVFGLLSWFHSDRTHPEGGPIFETSPEHPNRWPWCRKGTNEMRIAISRDGGKTWDRTSSREAWVPHGTEEDSYDRLVIGMTPPVRVGDEDWFYADVVDGDHLVIRNNPAQTPYYSDRWSTHNIALYTQKHNRYVSLKAGNQREVLITKPIEVTGDCLELNVDASRGAVRVAIGPAEPVMTFGGTTPSLAPHLLAPTRPNHGNHLPHAGYADHLLPGFAFADCEPVHTNSIAHPVRFQGELSTLRGKRVRLLVEMEDANLYGFRFCSLTR
ncbi:MAG: hypothetical protein J7639_14495 [Paenibacillaceae bacterium]|nr:hypothetical protein [Paenibacillaceae bacterium]